MSYFIWVFFYEENQLHKMQEDQTTHSNESLVSEHNDQNLV